MQDSESKKDNIQNLRQWITWAAVVGTALWAGYFFVFLIYQSIAGGSVSDNWFLQMVQKQPAATIGIAMSAITAFCLVALLEIARGPIEFEAMGFKFKGASGPVILWVFCFLAMIFGVWLLWDKTGARKSTLETAPASDSATRVLPQIKSGHEMHFQVSHDKRIYFAADHFAYRSLRSEIKTT